MPGGSSLDNDTGLYDLVFLNTSGYTSYIIYKGEGKLNTKTHKITMACLILTLAGLQGCDQIKKLTDYFKEKSTPKKPASLAIPEKTTPVQSPTTTNVPSVNAEKKELPANVLAKVGDWTMTLDEFNQRLKAIKEIAPDYDIQDAKQKELILDELINQELLVQDALRTGLDKKKELAEAIEEFKRTLLVREDATRIVQNISATDQEVLDYYNANKAEFAEPVKWKVREIVVETETDANALLVQLYQGADFIEIVKQKSKAKSAWQKDSPGLVTTLDFPKIETVVQALEVGQVSNVFKGPEGFYIVKLEEKEGGEQRKFEDVQNDIKTGLTLLKQQQALLNYLDELRKKTSVSKNANLLEEKAQ